MPHFRSHSDSLVEKGIVSLKPKFQKELFLLQVTQNHSYGTDEFGNSLLCQLCTLGDTDFAVKLINQGIGLDKYNDWGDTPLHIAAASGNFILVNALLNAGLRPLVLNELGQTPVDYARNRGHEEIADYIELYFDQLLAGVDSDVT